VSVTLSGMDTVYLDHAASTPMRAEALEAMTAVLSDSYANPSGAHRLARAARRQIDDARDQMAGALGCQPGDVVFTGGGTEADNLAILGRLEARAGAAVCPAGEHHAVLHPVEHTGGKVVATTATGVVDLDALASVLDPSVSVVSVMLANNETGMVTDLDAVADVVRRLAPEAVLHTDAVQALPWLDVATLAGSADLISVSAHKFGGPKGVGALATRPGVALAPHLLGGGQERGRRSGTHNTAGIVAMGVAAELTVAERAATVARVSKLRDRLADGLLAAVAGTTETGDRRAKIAGSCHLCFEGIESEALLFLLERDGICASAASSCASGAQDPSHVLAAMGYARELAAGSLRLSLGATTTADDIDHALAVIPPAIAQLRARRV
jgi:cysteine desulfurase